MSHLTQMAGLAVQNFVSAAVGLAVAVALIRGLVRRRSAHDRQLLGRPRRARRTRVLLPLVVRVRARAREPGRRPEPPRGHSRVTTVEGADADDPGRPDRQPGGDQGARHERRRSVQRQLGPPVREPERRSPTCSRSGRCSLIPFALTYTFGRMVERPAAGLGGVRRDVRALARRRRRRDGLRGERQPRARPRGVNQRDRRRSRAATWRARRSASARRPRGLFAASTTGTSTGAVNAHARQLHAARRRGAAGEHDARRGRAPAASAPASTACLIFALLSVFIAGLMVGRTPEYLGKKIQAAEMKLVVLYILVRAAGRPRLRGASRWCSTAALSLDRSTRARTG